MAISSTARDFSQREFDERCRKHGFSPAGFAGYYVISESPRRLVSVLNAGTRRRDQLAYLLRESRRYD